MESFGAAYFPAFVAWGIICASYALARRSWVALAVFGFLINLQILALLDPWPRARSAVSVVVNGAFLLTFVGAVLRNVWLDARSKR